jgi:hypothetical protein
MYLGAKEIHNLKKELLRLDKGEKYKERHCQYAKIDFKKVIREGTTDWEKWNDIIDHVIEDTNRTVLLLQSVLHEEKEDKSIEYYLSKLTTQNEIHLSNLASLLKEKKCVLFLGPDVLQVADRGVIISFNTQLCNILEAKLEDENIYYDEALKDHLTYMAQCYTDMPNYAQGDVQRIAKEEFERLTEEESIQSNLLTVLARIPARLIINANPDTMLAKHIEKERGIKCVSTYYDFTNDAIEEKGNANEDKDEAKKPGNNDSTIKKLTEEDKVKSILGNEVLLYNIFGTFEKDNSILYTESQFLEFINNVILGNPGLNSTVRKELNEQESYFFIGFDFEQWYFKILFQLLRLKKEKGKAISCNLDVGNISVINKEFFEEEFKVYFIDADIRNFLRILVEKINNQNL